MNDQALIQVRIDKKMKDDVSEVFSTLGIDISTAIRLFLQRCRLVKGIPFPLTVPEKPGVIVGVSKGKWTYDEKWYQQDRALDREIGADFYADSF